MQRLIARLELKESLHHFWNNQHFNPFEEKQETLWPQEWKKQNSKAPTTNNVQTLVQKLSVVKGMNENLSVKINDLEGHSRHNNIKIVGMPEGEEKGRPMEFVMNLIPLLFRQSNLSKPVTVNRAHHVPLHRHSDIKHPRTVFARIHFYQEKELLLWRSWQQQLTYNGLSVFRFPDCTPEVLEQRRSFREVMSTLRVTGIKFSLRFPTRLHVQYVQYDEQVKMFTSPLDTENMIRNIWVGDHNRMPSSNNMNLGK